VRHQRQVVVKGNCGDLEIVRSDDLSIAFERASDLGTLRCTGIVEREDENGARNMSSFPCSRGGSALDSAPWRSS